MHSRRRLPLARPSGLAAALAAPALALIGGVASAQGTSGLTANAALLCAPAGGAVGLNLDAGVANAGEIYLVAGSVTGTAPGTLIQGLLLPINFDAYTSFTISNAGAPALFPQTIGVLDGLGRASAQIVLPPGALVNNVGLHIDYAFFVADLQPTTILVPFTSNSVGVDIGASVAAAFTASATSGNAPLSVTFTNQSTGATSFQWTFGDGTQSTATNPTKIYTQGGTYTVALTASGPCGNDVETKVGHIQVPPTFTQVYGIFQTGNQCINCHTGAFPGGGLGYDNKNLAHASMVGVPSTCAPGQLRVASGNPPASLLVAKIREATFGTPNACGSPMPFVGLPASALSPGNIATIEAWIASGAPNN